MIKLKDLLSEAVTINKQQLKKMIMRAKRAGAKGYDIILSLSNDLSASPDEITSVLEKYRLISMTESINEELTDADIKKGDAYKNMSARGFEVSFVYGKAHYGGWQTLDYQFEPQYGVSGFVGVGSGPPESVDGWGKDKKIRVTSKMKKEMIKTLEDAIKSRYNGSEETSVLLRNGLRLSNVLSWVKRL